MAPPPAAFAAVVATVLGSSTHVLPRRASVGPMGPLNSPLPAAEAPRQQLRPPAGVVGGAPGGGALEGRQLKVRGSDFQPKGGDLTPRGEGQSEQEQGKSERPS